MADDFTPEEARYFETGGETALEEPVEEVVEEVEAVEETTEEEPSTVPHAALHQERERRKELQTQLDVFKAQSEQTDVLTQRLNQLEEMAKEPEPELPSYEEDPAENLNARLKAQEYFQAQQTEATQRGQAEQQFMQTYRQQAEQFAGTQKDFGEAYKFMNERRASMYNVLGYSPQDVARMVAQDERAFVYKSLQDGVNPAERIYALAKHDGYVLSEETTESQIDTIERGQAQKSLGSNGGAPKKTTLESLASMSDDDFAEATKDGKWKALWN